MRVSGFIIGFISMTCGLWECAQRLQILFFSICASWESLQRLHIGPSTGAPRRVLCELSAPRLLTNPGAQRSGGCGLSAAGGQTVPNRRFFDASCFCALSAHFDELERAEEKRIAV